MKYNRVNILVSILIGLVFLSSKSIFAQGQSMDEFSFNQPYGMVFDQEGKLLIADSYNNAIRIVSDNVVSTLSETDYGKDKLGFKLGALKDGTLKEAAFNRPRGIAVDSKGVIYVADTGNNVIRKIENDKVTTIAGNGKEGYKDGNNRYATFNVPSAIALGQDNNIYIADTMNNAIRKIDEKGKVSTLKFKSADKIIDLSKLNEPSDLLIDDKGIMYILDSGNQMIKKVEEGKISCYAGIKESSLNKYGYVEGSMIDSTKEKSTFNFPKAMCLGENGLMFVSDTFNNAIRVIKPDGTIATLIGDNLLSAPTGIAYKDGVLYIADMWHNKVIAYSIDFSTADLQLKNDFVLGDKINLEEKNSTMVINANGKVVDFLKIESMVNEEKGIYLPFRDVFEKFGMTVSWLGETREILVEKEGFTKRYKIAEEKLFIKEGKSFIKIDDISNDLKLYKNYFNENDMVIFSSYE